MKKVTVKVPGTCGELVQGIIDGVNFHITCPIDLYSYVTVKKDKSISKIQSNIEADKLLTAIKKTLQYFNVQDTGLQVTVETDLLSGKGMASSTADITAGIIATILVLGEEVDTDVVKEIALSIEPTDGSFLTGIVAFDHLQGEIIKKLGQIASLPILIFDSGGKIDTINFNSRKDITKLKLQREDQVKRAYQLVNQGVKEGNYELVGQGATMSSLANQRILHKSRLEELAKLVNQEDNILGINIAHSGTLVGVILTSQKVTTSILAKIKDQFPKLNYVTTSRIINGGYQIVSRS